MSKENRSCKDSVKCRLNTVLLLFALSGVFGVLGIVEMNKAARFQELNFLHLKYNHEFHDQVIRFKKSSENL